MKTKINKINKYKKKPVIVEAIQWDGKNVTYYQIRHFINIENILEIEIDDHLNKEGAGIPYVSKMYITTPEGKMLVDEGDYIIRGVKGEFYPCKPDIFYETYEKAE